MAFGLFWMQMSLLKLILLSLQLCLLATYVAGEESNICFRNGSSPQCTSDIRSRYAITSEAVENVRSRIKSLIESDKLRISVQSISTFDMSMGCYAIGQRLPSDIGCVSCHNCIRQMSSEVCDLFCSSPSMTPSIVAPSIPANASGPDSRYEKIIIPIGSTEANRNSSNNSQLTIVLAVIAGIFLFIILILLLIVGISLYSKKPFWKMRMI